MTRPNDEVLLAFLEETLGEQERASVLEQLEADPELAAELEKAAIGLEALRSMPSATPMVHRHGRIAPWWVAVASVATLAIAIPTTLYLAGGSGVVVEAEHAEQAGTSEFVLVLRSSWSDDSQLDPDEVQEREAELAAWTSKLDADGILVSASDLALERGMRFGSTEASGSAQYVAAVITLRTDDEDEVMAIAGSSPHLRYGGTVTVRRVGVAPQATSLLGEELYAREDATGEVAAADAALARAPEDVELLLAAGRARWSSWQYRQAVVLYTRAIDVAPDDWRPYTDRGIRRVAIREFDGAITDLERARELAPLNYDVSYYLGFAYFLEGRFEEAANEYLRCFDLADNPTSRAAQTYGFRSCSQIADDVGWRVAITDWTVRALRRAGRHEEAMELLDGITPGMPVEAYAAYYRLLLFYKGHITAEELLSFGERDPNDIETVGYGVANWYLVEGDTASAVELLEEIAVSPRWPAYGRIAAEVDLARLR